MHLCVFCRPIWLCCVACCRCRWLAPLCALRPSRAWPQVKAVDLQGLDELQAWADRAAAFFNVGCAAESTHTCGQPYFQAAAAGFGVTPGTSVLLARHPLLRLSKPPQPSPPPPPPPREVSSASELPDEVASPSGAAESSCQADDSFADSAGRARGVAVVKVKPGGESPVEILRHQATVMPRRAAPHVGAG